MYSTMTESAQMLQTSAAANVSVELSLLEHFGSWYQGVHGYLSVSVSVFGLASNSMNIVVLTRKSMSTSPTNLLLTALAIVDLLTMASYLPYAVYFHCVTVPEPSHLHTQGWIIYLLFNSYFCITTHTAAMWLTVALAVFRYIAVCRHVHATIWCNMFRAKLAVSAVLIVTPIFCIPNYILYKPAIKSNGFYWFEDNSFIQPVHKVFNFWLFGVALKITPCMLLVALSERLMKTMQAANTRRRSLISSSSSSERGDSRREHYRTTSMLLAVLLTTVLTELPQGFLALLSGFDERIFDHVYVPLGDVWDILVLINSAVNFILYCIMSRQFRQTFKQVFPCCQRYRHLHITAPAAAAVVATSTCVHYNYPMQLRFKQDANIVNL